MNFFKALINRFTKIAIIFVIYIVCDLVLFSLLSTDIKSKLYNNRAHRIKSFHYHHDLRPMASFYDVWGYEKYKIFTNNLGFKDKSNRQVEFKKKIFFLLEIHSLRGGYRV